MLSLYCNIQGLEHTIISKVFTASSQSWIIADVRVVVINIVPLSILRVMPTYRFAAKQGELYRCGRGECGQLGMKRLSNIGIPQKVEA